MTQQKSKLKPDNVFSIKHRLCAYHRAAGRRRPIACEIGTCHVMTNEAEQEALLEAASVIADSLVITAGEDIARIRSKDMDAAAEAAVKAAGERPTAVGSHLAAAMTLRLLLSGLRSEFLNPMWVPSPEDESRGLYV